MTALRCSMPFDMTPLKIERPSLASFGLSDDDVQRIRHLSSLIESNEAGCAWLDRLLPRDDSDSIVRNAGATLVGFVLFWGCLWPFFLVGLLLTPLINVVLRLSLKRDPKYASYQRFQAALADHERTQRQFWQELSGSQFEDEVAHLFSQLGYTATVTPRGGDEGIDIVLRKGGQRSIVQCKRYSKRASPAIARDLYGTLHATGAKEAFLVCTGGFTSGTRTFCRDKPICLLDLDDILELAKAGEPTKHAA